MRVFVAAFALTGVAAAHAVPAIHGGWVRVAEGPGAQVVFYARPGRRADTAARDNERRIQLLYDYRLPQQDPDTAITHRSALVDATIRCAEHAIRMGDMLKFGAAMGQGQRVERTHSSDLRYRPTKRNSIDAKIVDFACKEQAR